MPSLRCLYLSHSLARLKRQVFVFHYLLTLMSRKLRPPESLTCLSSNFIRARIAIALVRIRKRYICKISWKRREWRMNMVLSVMLAMASPMDLRIYWRKALIIGLSSISGIF